MSTMSYTHWKESVCSPRSLNSDLCSHWLSSSSSLLCSERRIWSRRRSYVWNWQTSERSWVRDASTHPLSLSLSAFACDTRTHIQTKLIKDGSTAIQNLVFSTQVTSHVCHLHSLCCCCRCLICSYMAISPSEPPQVSKDELDLKNKNGLVHIIQNVTWHCWGGFQEMIRNLFPCLVCVFEVCYTVILQRLAACYSTVTEMKHEFHL